jgi:hypothetical protein
MRQDFKASNQLLETVLMALADEFRASGYSAEYFTSHGHDQHIIDQSSNWRVVVSARTIDNADSWDVWVFFQDGEFVVRTSTGLMADGGNEIAMNLQGVRVAACDPDSVQKVIRAAGFQLEHAYHGRPPRNHRNAPQAQMSV